MNWANNDIQLLFHYSPVKSWKAVHFKLFRLQLGRPPLSIWLHLSPCHWQQSSCSPSRREVPLHNPAGEIITQRLPSTRSLKVARISSNQPEPGAPAARKRHQIALLPVPGRPCKSQELWDTFGILPTWGHHAGYQGRHGNGKETFFLLCIWKCYCNNSLLLFFFTQHMTTRALGSIIVTFTFVRGWT